MTALLVRDPFLAAPFRLMDELVRTIGTGAQGRVTGFTPALDVVETEERYHVLVDLPGVRPEDVALEVHDQVLQIAGTRTAPVLGQAQIAERPYGSFTRAITLPKGVDSDAITAEFRDGVLELQIPKPEEKRPKRITIGNLVEQGALGS